MPEAFEFADGMVKQLLTLATGSIGAIVALFDDDKRPGFQLAGSSLLMWAIGLLAFSVVAGIVTLGALTGQLTQEGDKPNANALSVRIPAMFQLLAFGGGVVAVATEVLRT